MYENIMPVPANLKRLDHFVKTLPDPLHET